MEIFRLGCLSVSFDSMRLFGCVDALRFSDSGG